MLKVFSIRKLALIAFLAALFVPTAKSQTIAPSQIRPCANGQVLVTISGVTSCGSSSAIALTTTGNSGPATFPTPGTLNIPTYIAAGTGPAIVSNPGVTQTITSNEPTNIVLNPGGTGPVLSPPVAPTVTSSTTGGTVAAATYSVVITYQGVVSGSETTASPATPVTTTGTTSTISVSTGQPQGATFFNIYINGHKQTPVGQCGYMGQTCVLTTTPSTGGAAPPGTNTATGYVSAFTVQDTRTLAQQAGNPSSLHWDGVTAYPGGALDTAIMRTWTNPNGNTGLYSLNYFEGTDASASSNPNNSASFTTIINGLADTSSNGVKEAIETGCQIRGQGNSIHQRSDGTSNYRCINSVGIEFDDSTVTGTISSDIVGIYGTHASGNVPTGLTIAGNAFTEYMQWPGAVNPTAADNYAGWWDGQGVISLDSMSAYPSVPGFTIRGAASGSGIRTGNFQQVVDTVNSTVISGTTAFGQFNNRSATFGDNFSGAQGQTNFDPYGDLNLGDFLTGAAIMVNNAPATPIPQFAVLKSTYGPITACGTTSDFAFVTANNSLATGTSVTFSGLTACSQLNGQTFTVYAANRTQITVAGGFTAVTTQPDFGLFSTQNVTSFSITSNVVTLATVNTMSVGQSFTLAGLTTGTYLNGVNLIVTSATGTSITAAFSHANVTSTSDVGIVNTTTNPFQVDSNGNVGLQGQFHLTAFGAAGFLVNDTSGLVTSSLVLPSGTTATTQPTSDALTYVATDAFVHNAITASGAFSNPMTTLGDSLYGGTAGAVTRLAGATAGAGTYVFSEAPTSSTAVAPAWLNLGTVLSAYGTLAGANTWTGLNNFTYNSNSATYVGDTNTGTGGLYKVIATNGATAGFLLSTSGHNGWFFGEDGANAVIQDTATGHDIVSIAPGGSANELTLTSASLTATVPIVAPTGSKINGSLATNVADTFTYTSASNTFASGYGATYASGSAVSHNGYDAFNGPTPVYFYDGILLSSLPSKSCLGTDGSGNVIAGTSCNPIFTGNITLTTATSDALTLTGVTTSSKCSFSPTNATAAGLTSTTLAGYYTVTANTFTLNHAATTASGATFGVICTPN